MIYDDVLSGTKLLKEKDFINNSNISKISKISKSSKLSITKLNTCIDTSMNGGSKTDSPRKYGNSFFHSSSSLQNSINSISFPKSTRFIASEIISPGFYNLPELSSKRAAAMGYGKKKVLVNDTTSPSPNAYTIQSIFEENLVKKKGTIFHPRIVLKNDVKNESFPGPQQYENNSPKAWLRNIPTTFKFRHGYYYDDTIKSFPSANAEMINVKDKKIGFNRRFEDIQIGMGYGNKIEAETKAVVANPGPGEYNSPSVFDKNKRYRIPLN